MAPYARPNANKRCCNMQCCKFVFGLCIIVELCGIALIHSPPESSKMALVSQIGDRELIPLINGPVNISIPGLVKIPVEPLESQAEISQTVKVTVAEGGIYSYLNTQNLWDASSQLPDWMKKYFLWHRAQRQSLNKTTYESMRFLVMSCTKSDRSCGGISDRLRPVPALLLLAHLTNRVLLIHWQRPCKLEEFLVPPEGGLDWRVPDWLEPIIPVKPVIRAFANIEGKSRNSSQHIVLTKYQSHHYGEEVYTNKTNSTYEEIYHDLWRVIFTPSPPVAQLISESMRALGLDPGKYVAAHARALYALDERGTKDTEKIALNALNCASRLSPGSKIYFASDSKHAVEFANTFATVPGKTKNIVTLTSAEHPLHLDKARSTDTLSSPYHPSDYYPAFRDIYILGQSRCISYGAGGFGSWASILGFNPACHFRYINRNCVWFDGEEEEPISSLPTFLLPSLLLPMEAEGGVNTTQALIRNTQETAQGDNTQRLKTQTQIISRTNSSLWNQSATLPVWLKDYFEWHANQLVSLTKENWTSQRFLVVYCSQSGCGGAADRLKPLPSILLVASMTNRIVFIHWTRPCKLEEFLVPPKGGMDWRLPLWMEPHVLEKSKQTKRKLDKLSQACSKHTDTIVTATLQMLDVGRSFYASTINQTLSTYGASGTSFDSFYHDMFHTVFTPSPQVANAIDEKMNELGLVSGAYASAHLRALYGRKTRPEQQTMRLTINALHCASSLMPRSPIYFAADNKLALETASKYSTEKSRPIVVWHREKDPLHLDKAESRIPSEYYDTFIDLYLLARSRCLAYSNGEFGSWAMLLGSALSCNIQHFRQRKIQECKWTDSSSAVPKRGIWYKLG